MQVDVKRLDKYRILIPRKGKMKVDGLVFADEGLFREFTEAEALQQVVNVAHLPGIVGYALGMPDIHWGYGFPIGGVAATDVEEGGVISPGGVGFDINCGVRLLRTNLEYDELRNRIEKIIVRLYSDIPAGVGSKSRRNLSKKELQKVLKEGADWVVCQGWGTSQDLEYCEENGVMSDANPDRISSRAYERGKNQLGTLGSGNHFLEIQVVDKIFMPEVAEIFGIFLGQITVMLHSGSRGFGHQVCSDYVKTMLVAMGKYGIEVPDRQLACAPFCSKEGQAYWEAMCCAANYAWANRQMMSHLIRESFQKVLKMSPKELGIDLVYDVAHNIAKFERHRLNDKSRNLCVHRKGATRAFGPKREELPDAYKEVGQPVIIPGDMGRYSYLLVGTEQAMKEAFGSSCHGAGRVRSRSRALKEIDYNHLLDQLQDKGIMVCTHGKRTLVEEAPEVYKDVDKVVEVMHSSGITFKVARMRPLGVIKG